MNIGKFNLELTPLPHVWWKTDLKDSWSGVSNFMFIRLDKDRADDSTYEHELTHLKQAYAVNGIFMLLLFLIYTPLTFLGLAAYAALYTVSQRFRFEMEAMAWAVSCEHKSFPKDPDRWFRWVSTFLTKSYKLDVREYTEDRIYDRVSFYWNLLYKGR